MAASRLISLLAAALPFTAAAVTTHGAERVDSSKAPNPAKLRPFQTEFRKGKTVMRNITISQGDVSISADRAEATGIDFNDSRWEFSGNVRVKAESRGTMQSDRAIVEFRDNRITRATVKGSPAQFEQKQTAGSADTARGRAGEIIYEIRAGTVRFANDAWLSNGQNEISGPLLVYDIRKEKVQATTSPDGAQRVQITINPKDGTKTLLKPDKPAPPQGTTGDPTP